MLPPGCIITGPNVNATVLLHVLSHGPPAAKSVCSGMVHPALRVRPVFPWKVAYFCPSLSLWKSIALRTILVKQPLGIGPELHKRITSHSP